MSRLGPKNLSVDFRKVLHLRNLIPSCYTLTHSDITAELFLTIGLKTAYNKINAMRDEVLANRLKQ